MSKVYISIHDATPEEYAGVPTTPDENNGTVWKNLALGSVRLTIFKPDEAKDDLL